MQISQVSVIIIIIIHVLSLRCKTTSWQVLTNQKRKQRQPTSARHLRGGFNLPITLRTSDLLAELLCECCDWLDLLWVKRVPEERSQGGLSTETIAVGVTGKQIIGKKNEARASGTDLEVRTLRPVDEVNISKLLRLV
jgi:hypothetical protein